MDTPLFVSISKDIVRKGKGIGGAIGVGAVGAKPRSAGGTTIVPPRWSFRTRRAIVGSGGSPRAGDGRIAFVDLSLGVRAHKHDRRTNAQYLRSIGNSFLTCSVRAAFAQRPHKWNGVEGANGERDGGCGVSAGECGVVSAARQVGVARNHSQAGTRTRTRLRTAQRRKTAEETQRHGVQGAGTVTRARTPRGLQADERVVAELGAGCRRM